MPPEKVLADAFSVESRFRRSVNLAADYRGSDALRGYVPTPLVRRVIERVAAGLASGSASRAWSITGPYGTGKSAFALFLTRLIGYPADPQARSLLRSEDPALYDLLADRLPGFPQAGLLVVPAVGSRQPLALTILDSLLDALLHLGDQGDSLSPERERVDALREQARSGEALPPQPVVDALVATARAAARACPGIRGLLIVYDELGKSLEYAALHPEGADVGLLQTLAETASRSHDVPITFLAILHQAFEHYAALVSPVQRREWEKVQGRFEDIGFYESAEELLRLVSRAIAARHSDPALACAVSLEVEQARKLGLFPRALAPDDASYLLGSCAPLHPTVALVLDRLFRSRLAQNERSLFAFLSSGEPSGLQEFLSATPWKANGTAPFYRLDRLYDYVLGALGAGLYAHSQGKRWAEVEDALARLPKESTALEVSLVKAIGLLTLLGDQQYLKASPSVLAYALAYQATAGDVDTALDRLTQLGIAVYRAFNDTYALWQGSDIDLDQCLERGLAQVAGADLAQSISRYGNLKPYIAKRHLHETGTFRYFTPWVVDLDELAGVAERPFGDADGAVVYVLLAPGTKPDQAQDAVAAFSASLPDHRRPLMFFAILRATLEIRQAFDELAAWEWVRENIHELEGDGVARRELAARRLAARGRFDRATGRCFELSSGHASALWVWNGAVASFASGRALSAALSQACDQAFDAAPIVKNELLNRRSLSSAAAAARRNLVEAMLTRADRPSLGMSGYPPEMSMYLSVLYTSRIHRRQGDRWAFLPPADEGPYRVRPMFEAMDRFLYGAEDRPLPVTDLYALLAAPPFGIREGLLPIYLVAALLCWGDEVALYEEGTFRPRLETAEAERLLRVPERFSVQRYRIREGRSRLLLAYARMFDPQAEPAKATVLGSVRSFMGFAAGLPGYTRSTATLSDQARRTREALFTAREPHTMLFRQLPAAVGIDGPDSDTAAVDEALGRLRAGLLELQTAYDNLLRNVEAALLAALRLPAPLTRARPEIGRRAALLETWAADTRLRAFLFRLRDEQLADREWLESVAALVVSKPPRNWSDGDVRSLHVQLQDLAAQLRRAEELAVAQAASTAQAPMLRLGITDSDGVERQRVLHLRADLQPELESAVSVLAAALDGVASDAGTRLTVLALLVQRALQADQPRKDRHD